MDFSLYITDDNQRTIDSGGGCSSKDKLKTEARRAVSSIQNWPDYELTPLCSLPGLAQSTGGERIEIKDEAQRFGLGSFKALGGTYAISRLLEGQCSGSWLTVCCATDARKQSIEHYGARVVRTAGNYDDSVRQAQVTAEREGWTVVSDTSYEGYMDIPMDVMADYSIMTIEAVEQQRTTNTRISANRSWLHGSLCGGAIATGLWRKLSENRAG